jgi:hypothetical protein
LVQIGGFKSAGLSVKVSTYRRSRYPNSPDPYRIKDCIVLSMTPPEPDKCPFRDFRLVVPIRLATNLWVADGSGIGAPRDSLSEPRRGSREHEYTHPSTPSDGGGP